MVSKKILQIEEKDLKEDIDRFQSNIMHYRSQLRTLNKLIKIKRSRLQKIEEELKSMD